MIYKLKPEEIDTGEDGYVVDDPYVTRGTERLPWENIQVESKFYHKSHVRMRRIKARIIELEDEGGNDD